jgi:hypothetical protein
MLMLYLVYLSVNTKIDLVADDYYAQEIAYEQVINKIENEKKLDKTVIVSKTESSVSVNFPELNSTGTINFFRPGDKDLDRIFEILTDEQGNQQFAYNNFKPGIYRIKIDCKANDVDYYKELQLVF